MLIQYLLRIFICFLFWNLVLGLFISLGFSLQSGALEIDSIAVRIYFLFLILKRKEKMSDEEIYEVGPSEGAI